MAELVGSCVLIHAYQGVPDPKCPSTVRESSVTRKSAITVYAVEENHVIDWDKTKVVDRDAQRQTRLRHGRLVDKRDSLEHCLTKLVPVRCTVHASGGQRGTATDDTQTW